MYPAGSYGQLKEPILEDLVRNVAEHCHKLMLLQEQIEQHDDFQTSPAKYIELEPCQLEASIEIRRMRSVGRQARLSRRRQMIIPTRPIGRPSHSRRQTGRLNQLSIVRKHTQSGRKSFRPAAQPPA